MDELSTRAPAAAPLRWWRRPSVISLAVVLAVLGAAMAWSLLSVGRGGGADPVSGLPWQVRVDGAGGAEVFGLAPGRSTLAEVQARLGDDLHIGLIVPNGQAPALEAFVESFRAGFITGRLVLAFDAEAGWLQRARERSPKNEIGEGGRSRRYSLAADDLAQAGSARLTALAFLPSAQLDEAIVTQRFGSATERHAGPAGELQLLYPAQGVAVALPPAQGEAARAKAVIQYVAPREFEARLRAPLLAASAPAR